MLDQKLLMGDQQRNFPEWEMNRPRVGIPTMGTPRVSLSNLLNPVLVSLENSTPCVGRLTRGVFLPTQGVFVSCVPDGIRASAPGLVLEIGERGASHLKQI